jgi:hypothetical protein
MFGMADLSFELFSDLEIADPRSSMAPGVQPRDALIALTTQPASMVTTAADRSASAAR